MSTTEVTSARAAPQPLPENIVSVQPGGGVCYRIELAWAAWRRWWLKLARPGYVRRMAELRRGDPAGAPHEILDPRDLKYCRNRCACDWPPEHDPFRWRRRLPFAHWGWAEMNLMGWPLLAVTVLLAVFGFWYLAIVPGALLCLIVWFFRDPPRRVPQGPGLVVAPADGKVVEISKLEQHPDIGGPAMRIGIFLSVFDVHINRSPCSGTVRRITYQPGQYLDARDPNSGQLNEANTIVIEPDEPSKGPIVVRQIAGLIARRIVCSVKVGDRVETGQRIGLIKFGSRTELIVKADSGYSPAVAIGDRAYGALTVMARQAGSAFQEK